MCNSAKHEKEKKEKEKRKLVMNLVQKQDEAFFNLLELA